MEDPDLEVPSIMHSRCLNALGSISTILGTTNKVP